jgi:beta-fructofuranosidase
VVFRSETHWRWDFWFAPEDPPEDDTEDHTGDGPGAARGRVHLFYLFAPKSLGDPELRHVNARVGHAVSTDLRTWTDLGEALPPALPGTADDMATWTGSVIRDPGGGWRMFHTGIAKAEDGLVQRVMSATSEDLTTWHRTDLLLEADPRWYERQDWRDPWVEWDPEGGLWRMYLCATALADTGDPGDGPSEAAAGPGAAHDRGVIAMLTSPDLDHWEAGPPVVAPGEFRQMEVPQVVPSGSRVAMLFCANDVDHSAARLARGAAPEYGTHVVYADSLEGPFRLRGDAFLSGDNGPSMYAGRAIRHGGRWWFLAWDRLDETGAFVGGLSDPFPLDVVDDELVVDFGGSAAGAASY